MQHDLAILGFARCCAYCRHFQAVCDGIAQQMFKRRDHFFQHAAIHFYLLANDLQAGFLTHVLGGTAHGTVQAVGDAGQRHHTNMHQCLLQITRHARLLGQRGLGFVQANREVLLHRADVVDALRDHAGELLQAGETVELQRIEWQVVLVNLRQR